METTLAEAIKKIRKRKKMSQGELAKKAGISAMSVSRYEAGKTKPNLGAIIHIASALSDKSLIEMACQRDDGIENESDEVTKNVNRNLIQVQLENNDSEEYTTYLMIISMLLSSLNSEGMRKAAESVEMIAKIPDYIKGEEK